MTIWRRRRRRKKRSNLMHLLTNHFALRKLLDYISHRKKKD